MSETIDWMKIENRIKATPLDLLKQGIEEERWDAIEACYLMLTGNRVTRNKNTVLSPAELETTVIEEPAKKKRGRPKKAVALPAEPKILDEEGVEVDEHKNFGHSEIIRSRSTPLNNKSKKNRFVDDGIQAIEDKKFTPKVVKTSSLPKRPKYSKLDVICSKCGRKEAVDPSLGPQRVEKHAMRYVCNDCSCGG